MMTERTIVSKTKTRPRGVSFFEEVFLEKKLNNWFGYVLVLAIAGIFGFFVAEQTEFGIGLFGFVIALFVAVVCILDTEAGLYVNIMYAFFAFHFSRFFFHDSFPVGVITDALILITFFSMIVKRVDIKQSFTQFVHTAPVVGLLVLVLYLLIEFFNPYGQTPEGWFQTFRRFVESVLILFIAYNAFTDFSKIKRFITVLFVLSLVCGLYGCLQQWHGLFSFEKDWVMTDSLRFGLFFINGGFRKFSTMSDPTAYGIAMAAVVIFFVIIAWYIPNKLYRTVLILGSIFMMLGMAYSGTRTANAMMIGGLGMFILLTFNKKATRAFAVLAALAFLFLLYAPIYNNATINRFRTSFMGSDDESFKVREVNRTFIQPYIYQHPIGAGLGTVGGGGSRYAPNHYLAGFPPDSGYLKKALETGWIGLALICFIYFVILRYGIHAYFSSKNEKHKILYAASLAVLFSFYVGEFAQEALGQITDMVIYYPIMAVILKLRYFDQLEEDLSGEASTEAG